jgi:hypothetical protein
MVSAADSNHDYTSERKIASTKFYFQKIVYTIMLLDMGLAPAAFQLWQKK